MKKTLIIIILSFASLVSYAQEHITFNGAKFGVERSSFLSSINTMGSATTRMLYGHTYKDVYNREFIKNGMVNTYSACYYIHSSLKTKIVWEELKRLDSETAES